MSELLKILERVLGNDFAEYEVNKPQSSNRVIVSNSKVRIVVLNWKRAVGFDKVCSEAKYHERSRNKKLPLIICANSFSDPAKMMGNNKHHTYLTLYELEELEALKKIEINIVK